jgi:hypothetical protein
LVVISAATRAHEGAPEREVARVRKDRRRLRIVAVLEAQQDKLGPLAKRRQSFGDALGFVQALEAPVKIDDAFKFGRLIGLFNRKSLWKPVCKELRL